MDDCFDCDEAHDYLLESGFKLERFSLLFSTPEGAREQSVPDPMVIKLANRHGWIILTTDSNMYHLHRKEIAQSRYVGIVATAHNAVETIMPWAAAFVKLKPRMEKNGFKKLERPWYAQFSRQGRFTVGPKLVTWA
ncbi:MAG TPA: DUF5615 family PIN-like protein [Bryobacteraceae bacterium]|nr:DUF5615 family PIN-like protein [Bryobacteraceae bacterium]